MEYTDNKTIKKNISLFAYIGALLIAFFTLTLSCDAAAEKRAELVVDVETGKILHSYAAYKNVIQLQ